MVWPRLRYGVHVGSGYLDVANKQWVVATTPDGIGNLFDRIICHRNRIISHLNWVCVFLGFHSFGLYIHNDTISALGRPQDMFRDTAIQLQPVFAQWIQKTHYRAPQFTAPSESSATSIVWGGDFLVVGGKVAIIPIVLGTSDFIVHHIHAFTIHVTVLILLKGCLYARNSGLKRRKRKLRGGFRFPCDGPGRGGTCQISAWDSVFLGLFWIYNSLSIVIFNFSWKIQSDVWGSSTGRNVSHITGGNFRQSANTINGWLRDFLWAQSSQVIQSYGSSLSAYGLIFLGAHFVWAFSLIFLFSGRGYWQELIESIVWAHNKLKLVPFAPPFALSIVQGRAVGVAHFLLGGIATTWSFFLARIISVG
jgi:photosystem I P700 chlorophyll a apoprotein A1